MFSVVNIYNLFLRNVICDTPEWMLGALGFLSTLFILLDVRNIITISPLSPSESFKNHSLRIEVT